MFYNGSGFSKKHDLDVNPIYSKEDEHSKKYIKERFIFDDGDGRKYMISPNKSYGTPKFRTSFMEYNRRRQVGYLLRRAYGGKYQNN